ncbi:MAG: tRNA lysidine(34) synthetase TilS [Gammaproteobacteria bacterium]|nr:MAG: tRNA lysidine(34) synthetase TilS [Gammaproteobacteria bacterium]
MAFSETTLYQILTRLPRPSGWRVAFSGGLDSTVLLTALARLRDRVGLPLCAVHVHHGLLPHAEAWTEHCRRVCDRLEVPLEMVRLALEPVPGESLEAQAREARYQALGERLQPNEMLLLAQHQDDQAETLLLQLLRGAGIEGLAGMARCRPWQGGWQARPLLDFSRSDLERWARAEGLEWIEDPSNQDLRFDRNFVRRQLMPLLRERWPAASQTIARSAGHLAASLAILRQCIEEDLKRCQVGSALSITAWAALEPEARAEALRAWVRLRGAPVPDQHRLEEIERQALEAAPGAAPRVEWDRFAVRRYRDRLFLLPRELPSPPADCPWPDHEELPLPAGLGKLRRVPAADGIPDRCWREGRVVVRWQVEGIGCRLPGREGTRGLRKLCQERGIPPWSRPLLPLVFVDDRVVAIGDLWTCEVGPREPDEPASGIVWEERPEWLEHYR